MNSENLPPHDVEAEKAVLGSLLVDGDAVFKVASSLKPEAFFIPEHLWIYDVCLRLYQRAEAINQITVARELAQQNKLEEVGGAAYLSHLVASVPTSLHIEYYARIVSRLDVMRQLIKAAGEIAAIGYKADADVDDAVIKAEDVLFAVLRKQSPRYFVSLKEVLGQYFEETEPPVREEQRIPHVLTNFAAIDDLLGGLQRSDLIILGARPSSGKTSLALNIARNAAINQKACVAIFSLEMSRQDIARRLLASESGVDCGRLRLGQYTEREERRIMDASGVLADARIFIDDSPQLRMVEMHGKAKRLHFEHPIDLIVVDYIQLIRDESRRDNRVQELSEITRSLKALAREISAPVIALSQLSRAVEQRMSHKPVLSDLRDSGSIEQDADVVIFISRDEMYIREEDWRKNYDIESTPYPRGVADIVIAKHRNGPTGERKLRFISSITKFEDLEVEVSAA
ncbi:MAG: replicative DNA helicase [Chloroflexi bacterium]|nr:replicative DNA helicase [Chloroflexota bacterium]